MKQKVLAFILRPSAAGHSEILLHSFNTAPDLALRLPGGGVDTAESPQTALFRELREETGLTDLRLERKLGVQRYYKAYIQAEVERHDFLLWAGADLPDTWQHVVVGKGDDAGDIFGFCWLGPDSLSNVDEEHRPFLNSTYLPELFEAHG